MMCPLRDLAVSIDLQGGEIFRREGETAEAACDRMVACKEEACAWWVPEADACAVRALVVELNLAREERNQKIDAYEESH